MGGSLTYTLLGHRRIRDREIPGRPDAAELRQAGLYECLLYRRIGYGAIPFAVREHDTPVLPDTNKRSVCGQRTDEYQRRLFGLADVSITNIAFHTNNGVGDVQGNFLFKAIPWIKANVGGVHFGTGGSVSVDDIGLSFDLVGIAKVSVDLKFLNQPDKKGFSEMAV